MIAHWLRAHLEATGRANRDGISRAITASVCRTCGARVLRGLDDEILARPTTVDATEIDRLGEVLALASGRPTYEVMPEGRDRLVLVPRSQWRIAAGAQRGPIHSWHECGRPLPAAANTARPLRHRRPLPATPPF